MTSRIDTIFAALVSAHAIPRVLDLAKQLGKDSLIIPNLSERGNKDVNTIAKLIGAKI